MTKNQGHEKLSTLLELPAHWLSVISWIVVLAWQVQIPFYGINHSCFFNFIYIKNMLKLITHYFHSPRMSNFAITWQKQAASNFMLGPVHQLSIYLSSVTILHLGSISPNFVRQAKRHRRIAFGKKFAIQFHQHFKHQNVCVVCLI